jgi:nicotinate-nucleotide adenylyltransferase
MVKVGLFFGSFNPIHIGHLIIANTMLENTDLSEVWFVVSPQNPFKKSTTLAHEADRLYMVRQAISDNYRMRACDIEFHMDKPSYTIDTLVRLNEKYKDHEFKLILGEDNLEHFHKWKNAEQILKTYQLYVYPRPKCAFSEMKNHPSVRMVDAPLIDISATFIRNLIKSNKSVKYLIPEEVAGFIKSKGIYDKDLN